MIDVIIPAYNSYNTIDRTLSSISLQSCRDKLNVYIINDGSNGNFDQFVNFYKKYLNIKELSYDKNMGPGYAREYGIKNSSGKYIVFIDSDDSFYDSYSLYKLYNAISSSDYDFVNSAFYEQKQDELKIISDDVVWMHGKIYKRSFIEKNNIHFNNSRNNEDNGFNTLLLLNKPKEMYIDEPTYIWNNNDNSITRRNNHEYKYSGIYGYIYNMSWALNQKKDNKEISKIAYAALYTVYLTYIEFTDKSNIKELIKESKSLYDIYMLYPFSYDEKVDILSLQFENLYSDVDKHVLLTSYISFNKFLEIVGGKND